MPLVKFGFLPSILLMFGISIGLALGDCFPGIEDRAGLFKPDTCSQIESYLKNMPYFGGPRIQIETYSESKIDLGQWVKTQWKLAQKGCIRIVFLKNPLKTLVMAPDIFLKSKTILPDDVEFGRNLLVKDAQSGRQDSLDYSIAETVKFFEAVYRENSKEVQIFRNSVSS